MNYRRLYREVMTDGERDYFIMRRSCLTPFCFSSNVGCEHWVRASWGLSFEEFVDTFDLRDIGD